MAASALSTGLLTVGTTLVFNGVSYLDSIQVFTDGTNAGTVTVYNNTAGSGQVVGQLVTTGASLSASIQFSHGIRCDVGLTVVVSGTGATAVVTFGAA